MWNRETWSKIMSWLRKVRMNRRPKWTWRTIHYAKPELEWLTPRIVPANVACTFIGPVGGGPGTWDNPQDWLGAMPDDTGSDTVTIAAGAVCVLDQASEVKIAGLTVAGDLTVKSQLNVHAGGSLPGGNGDTGVTSTGLLDVTAPDAPGATTLLDTDTLSTAASSATNLSIDDGGELDVDFSGVLNGITSITGLLTAKNIDAFSGASIALGGTGTIGGPGQLDAEVNAAMTFTASSAWTILPGSPVGGALKEGNFFVDGPLAVNTPLDPGGDITLDPSGTIGGTGSLDEWSEFNMLGGILEPAGGVTLEPTADFKTVGSSLKYLLNTTITNLSPYTNLGGTGTLGFGPGSTFDNAAGTVEVSLPSITDNMGGDFINDANGTLVIEPPASTPTVISVPFTNTGTLETEGGELTLETFGDTSDTLDGTLILDDDVTLLGVFTSPIGFVEDAGLGHLKLGDPSSDLGITTGSLTLTSGSSSVISGNLEVTGTGTLTGPGFLNNSGTLALDLGSTATIGSYQQSSTGTLEEHASGNGVNSKLSVSGDAQLSGILDMEFDGGYMPTSGDTFTVLTAGAVDAHFDTTPDNMTVTYGPNGVSLTQN